MSRPRRRQRFGEKIRPPKFHHHNGILVPWRPKHSSPQPAATFQLSGLLEYREATIHDGNVLMNPDETRLGRRVYDVVPSAFCEDFLRHVRKAKREHRAVTMAYTTSTGVTGESRIVVAHRDLILVTAARQQHAVEKTG